MDQVSVDRIKLLHPDLRNEALQILKEISALGIICRYTHTLRSFVEQDGLFALGRTKVNPDGKTKAKPMGNVVTQARGGQSIHNYGLAIDFALGRDTNGDGKMDSLVWDTVIDLNGDKKSDWMQVVAIFKKYGWSWGGDWTRFKDRPHVEKTFGNTLKQLQTKYKANGNKNYVKL